MANQRLNATISIGGTIDRSLTRGLTNTQGQIGELQSVIGKATRKQTRLSREIKDMGRDGMNVEPLRRQYARLSDEIDRARRKQDALQRLAGADVAGKFGRMTSEVGRLARRTAMVGTAVGAGIFGVANSTAQLGDNVAKTADKIGMGVEELQAYRYAAERSGIETRTFDMATQRMVRRVSEAAQGSGEAKDAIKELGLSAEALASMTPDEQLNHFADALQNVENHGDRVRLAMRLFDSEGVAMVNMLRDGSAGLQQYAEDARRTGYILSEQAARDAETFQDKLLDTKLSLFGLKNIIGSDLMPVVSEMMAEFTGWLSENRQQVREWSALFADRLKASVPVIRDLASGIGTVVAKVGSAVATTANLVGGFDNLGMIIGTLIASKAIWSVVSFGVAIGQAAGAVFSLAGGMPALGTAITAVIGVVKAFGLALLTTPIGWVVGGLAAIAGGAYLIYKQWDRIGPWFGDLWEGVKRKASNAWEWLKGLFDWSPRDAIAWAWNGIKRWLAAPLALAKVEASDIWEGVKTVFGWSPLGLIIEHWTPMAAKVGEITGLAMDLTRAAWDWMKAKLSWSPLQTVRDAWGGLKDWFRGLWDDITLSAQKAIDWIAGKLEWIGNAFGKVRDALSWGDDETPDDVRARLGGSNAAALNLGSMREPAEERGRQAAERALPRPDFSTSADTPSPVRDKAREIQQSITNYLTLHVERREAEPDADYAERIAEMVMEQLNQRQQGALYDG